MFSGVKGGKLKLEAGQSQLYTWQDPLGKRELTWSAGDTKNQTNDLVKVVILLYSRIISTNTTHTSCVSYILTAF